MTSIPPAPVPRPPLPENASSNTRAPIDAVRLEGVLALCAALLLGAGLIFWVAANWQEQSRQFKYHLLQAAVLAPALLAVWRPLRLPGLLLSMLALGGLLAFVGQTYQTGADPWQLFAAWAVLALPVVLLGRHDGLWALWVLICGTTLGLWSGDRLFSPFGLRRGFLVADYVAAAGWLLIAALPLALARFGLLGEAGMPRPAIVSRRVAALMAITAWSAYVLSSLFGGFLGTSTSAGIYLCNVALLCVLACATWLSRPRDFVVLAGLTLAFDTLFLATVVKGWFLMHVDGLNSLSALFFTFVAAVTIGGSSLWFYRVQQRAAQEIGQ